MRSTKLFVLRSRRRPLVRLRPAGRRVADPVVVEVPGEIQASKDRREFAAHVEYQHVQLGAAVKHARDDHPGNGEGRIERTALSGATWRVPVVIGFADRVMDGLDDLPPALFLRGGAVVGSGGGATRLRTLRVVGSCSLPT